MTKKKQTTKTEVASEVKETSPVVTDTAAPVTPPAEPVAVTTTTATHGQAAEIHATEAKEKAVVAGDAAKEASSEAALVSKTFWGCFISMFLDMKTLYFLHFYCFQIEYIHPISLSLFLTFFLEFCPLISGCKGETFSSW